jgi:hypothetical protein
MTVRVSIYVPAGVIVSTEIMLVFESKDFKEMPGYCGERPKVYPTKVVDPPDVVTVVEAGVPKVVETLSPTIEIAGGALNAKTSGATKAF